MGRKKHTVSFTLFQLITQLLTLLPQAVCLTDRFSQIIYECKSDPEQYNLTFNLKDTKISSSGQLHFNVQFHIYIITSNEPLTLIGRKFH